jgi:hypothetical protein
MRISLLWGAAFGVVGAACAAIAVRGAAGEGWETMPYVAGAAAFALATLARRLFARPLARARHPRRRAAALGALVTLLSYPLAWLFATAGYALLGGPSSPGDSGLGIADAASATLVLSFGSLLLTGWWTLPVGAALGALLARVGSTSAATTQAEAAFAEPIRVDSQEGGARVSAPMPPPSTEAASCETAPNEKTGDEKPVIALLVLFVLGLALSTVGGWVYPPLYDLPAALEWKSMTIVLVVMFAASAYALRRQQYRLVFVALSSFGIVPTAVALVVGARLTLNGLLDRAEPTHHVARVLDVDNIRSSTGPGRPFKRVEVESWRKGDPDPWVDVNPRLYAEVTPNASDVGVVTKPGWLGIEWIVEAHLELPDDAPSGSDTD